MQQKGRTEQILDRLQEMINNGQGSLAPGKISLPKEEISRLILELSLTMETELKQYREITDKRAKVLKEAKKQADDIIYEAEQSASRIRISGRKTDVAPVRVRSLPEADRRALDNANEIYAASLIYTDEMMAEMQEVIDTACEQITQSYEHAIADLQQKSRTIAENRRELMEDLKSMEKEDRYQQIMEIGQLLSEELYHARKHAQGEPGLTGQPTQAEQGSQPEVSKPEQLGQAMESVQAEQGLQPEQLGQALEPERSEQGSQPEQAGQTLEPERSEQGSQPEQLGQATQPETSKPEQASQAIQPEASKPAQAEDKPLPEVKMEAAAADMPESESSEDIAARLMQEQTAQAAAIVDAALHEDRAIHTAEQIEEGRGEVAEITEEVSEAIKKDAQPSLSNSVIEAMKRAARKAVLGMEETEDTMLPGEYDEDDYEDDPVFNRTPTQPLDTKEINRQAMAHEAEAQKQSMTPEERKAEQHRAFVEQHAQKVKEEEEKWLNAVYAPPIPDVDAVDPIVAMVLKEKEDAKRNGV